MPDCKGCDKAVQVWNEMNICIHKAWDRCVKDFRESLVLFRGSIPNVRRILLSIVKLHWSESTVYPCPDRDLEVVMTLMLYGLFSTSNWEIWAEFVFNLLVLLPDIMWTCAVEVLLCVKARFSNWCYTHLVNLLLVRHTERRGWRNDSFSIVFAASMQQSRESAETREVNDKMSDQDISYKSQLSDSTFPPCAAVLHGYHLFLRPSTFLCL